MRCSVSACCVIRAPFRAPQPRRQRTNTGPGFPRVRASFTPVLKALLSRIGVEDTLSALSARSVRQPIGPLDLDVGRRIMGRFVCFGRPQSRRRPLLVARSILVSLVPGCRLFNLYSSAHARKRFWRLTGRCACPPLVCFCPPS